MYNRENLTHFGDGRHRYTMHIIICCLYICLFSPHLPNLSGDQEQSSRVLRYTHEDVNIMQCVGHIDGYKCHLLKL